MQATSPKPAWRRWTQPVLNGLLALAPGLAVAAPGFSSAEILQSLRTLQTTGTVLYVAAHPDDENTRLIAYLAQGRGYRTGYLALTRGDGGQNLIGPELREELGVIRTQELLAARRLDQGEQFFTRAVDFGYSKHPDEALATWDRDAVLADVVRVIRQFQPDVIITRFSLEPGITHGHHTSSAMMAVEAFTQAADPTAYPEQLDTLQPWQAKRVVWNSWSFGRNNAGPADNRVTVDVGGYNPVVGQSFGEIAALSRSMHKSQGFGSVGSRGEASENFDLLAGEPATADFMDGIDPNWSRFPGGARIDGLLADIVTQFDALQPERSVPGLLQVRRALAAMPDVAIVERRRAQVEQVLQACLGLYVETTADRAAVAPGETVTFTHRAILRRPGEVRWREATTALPLNENVEWTQEVEVPVDAPLSEPYWLTKPGTVGLFRVDDPALIGRGDSPPVFPFEQHFEIGAGHEPLTVTTTAVDVENDRVRGELRHEVKVVAPVTVSFSNGIALFRPGQSRDVAVQVSGATTGSVTLTVPTGWQVSPSAVVLEETPAAGVREVGFSVTAPAVTGEATLGARVNVAGMTYDHARVDIAYDHIPRQLWQPWAELHATVVDLEVKASHVGYLPGAGDDVPQALERMGVAVTLLDDADLTAERLAAFDTVVIGIRAFNTREALRERSAALFDYTAAGGTVIVQYNTNGGLQNVALAPYPLSLSRDRVVDEQSPVTILAPDHPAMTTPNRITAADFEGWVQERGLYFPNRWDDAFTPLLETNDPGEEPTQGSLLVARHGEGWFVYTGISWFRELPAGVPGAYRLFANLVSLGHE